MNQKQKPKDTENIGRLIKHKQGERRIQDKKGK